MSTVIPARVDRRLIKKIDRIVNAGSYLSRSDAVRDAIRRLVSTHDAEEPFQIIHKVVAQIAAAIIRRSLDEDLTDIILFGSVSEGRATRESDIDLFILMKEGDPSKLTRDLVTYLYPIMLASDSVITPLVYIRQEFLNLLEQGYIFAREILQNGTQIYGDLLYELRDRKTS